MKNSLNEILGNNAPTPNQQPSQAPASEMATTSSRVEPFDYGKAEAEKPTFTPPTIESQGTEQGQTSEAKVVPPLATPTQQPKPEEPTEKPRMSYVEMYQRLNPFQPPTKEELEKERKKAKREKVFAAIGDGISALSNLYFTTQYAPNMYNQENAQSARIERKWQRLQADRDAQMNAYINNLMSAAQADGNREDKDRNWQRLIGMDEYKKKKDAAELQYKKDRDEKKDERWKDSYNQKENQFKENMTFKEKQQTETARHHQATEGLAGAQLGESRRHHLVSENQGAQRIGGNRKQETIRLNDGNVYSFSPEKKGALTSLAPTMIKKAKDAAERYSKAQNWKAAKHYKSIAIALEKARSKDAIAAIISSNVGDFPSLDTDVRTIIEVPNSTRSTSIGGFNINNYQRGGSGKKTTNKPPLN
ncbi:hypothetical protein [Hoylesella nanceiensis]|uniref:hypothetical protein n=1 Tax=Hoylesella nanceiensis TaxID=425941 RepID=UPI0028EC49C8|nr:hypothetical protein [Hoylesella nanceiensis]